MIYETADLCPTGNLPRPLHTMCDVVEDARVFREAALPKLSATRVRAKKTGQGFTPARLIVSDFFVKCALLFKQI
jgi:hypothetical protein